MKVTLRTTIIILAVLLGIVSSVKNAHDLSKQRTLYQLEQGIWAPVETERQFMLLQSMLHQMSAGTNISPEEYESRRDVSLGYLNALIIFTRDNPTFDAQQLDIVYELEDIVQRYHDIDVDRLPEPNDARQLASIIDKAVQKSHQLVNIRRQVAEAANVHSIKTIEMALIIQVLTVAMLLIGGGWLLRATYHSLVIANKQKASAEAANQQLRYNMMQTEELAIEQERVRVAREIHDGLGHHLNNIKVHAGVANRAFDTDHALARDSLTTVKTEIAEAQRELRRAIDALVSEDHRFGNLEDLLAQSIRALHLSGIRSELQISGLPRELPEQIKHTLYRIGQEALSNVRQHSHAKQASILIDYQKHYVRFIIEDDGIGLMTNTEQRRGHGLDNLQERAAFIGGKTEIETRPGQGVRVVVEVPT